MYENCQILRLHIDTGGAYIYINMELYIYMYVIIVGLQLLSPRYNGTFIADDNV